jgi:hypothetical protein
MEFVLHFDSLADSNRTFQDGSLFYENAIRSQFPGE